MLFYEPYRTARRFLLNRNMERVSLSVFFSVERGRSFPLRPQADLDHSGFPCAFSVEPLQSRINCRARSVNRHGYLGGLFAGVQESIKLGFLVGSPSARCGFHFSAFSLSRVVLTTDWTQRQSVFPVAADRYERGGPCFRTNSSCHRETIVFQGALVFRRFSSCGIRSGSYRSPSANHQSDKSWRSERRNFGAIYCFWIAADATFHRMAVPPVVRRPSRQATRRAAGSYDGL